ncbi:MAG: hypothetical protein ABSH38_01630 [Verrucomicrobiota bacterium]
MASNSEINRLVSFTVTGSMCKACTYCFFQQLSFLKDIADVFGDDRSFPLQQFRNLRLRQPNGVVFQCDLQPRAAVLGFVKDEFRSRLLILLAHGELF